MLNEKEMVAIAVKALDEKKGKGNGDKSLGEKTRVHIGQ